MGHYFLLGRLFHATENSDVNTDAGSQSRQGKSGALKGCGENLGGNSGLFLGTDYTDYTEVFFAFFELFE